MTDRTEIPTAIAEEALFCSDRTCCVCRQKGKPVQIHHIDGRNDNHSFDNLAVLCLECHNGTQQKGGFDRKLSPGQVALYRQEWLAELGRTLNSDQLEVLRMLHRMHDAPQSIAYMSAKLRVSSHSVKRTISFLVERHILTQSVGERGRPHWDLTNKGRIMIGEDQPKH